MKRAAYSKEMMTEISDTPRSLTLLIRQSHTVPLQGTQQAISHGSQHVITKAILP